MREGKRREMDEEERRRTDTCINREKESDKIALLGNRMTRATSTRKKENWQGNWKYILKRKKRERRTRISHEDEISYRNTEPREVYFTDVINGSFPINSTSVSTERTCIGYIPVVW